MVRYAFVRRRRLRWIGASLVVLSVALVTMSACGGGGEEQGASSTNGAGTTITDCTGYTATFSEPPERVVILSRAPMELLLYLGLEDRVAGRVTFTNAPQYFAPELNEAGQAVQVIGSNPLPREVLLEADPDFAIGAFASNFEGEQTASQDELADLGVGSYRTLGTACEAGEPLTTFDPVYRDLENLGSVFGVEDRAAELTEEMQATVQEVGKAVGDAEGPRVFVFEYDAPGDITEAPSAAGNRQNINAVIEQAGATNIFEDLEGVYEKVGWEEVVARDPEVIITVVYDRGDPAENAAGFEEARDFLLSFEAISEVEAVREERFAEIVYEAGSEGTPRNADALRSLAEQLYPDRFE